MTRYYIDACIWRDYFEDRKDKFRPLGEWAFQLLKKIVDDEDVVVISDHLLEELQKYISEEKVEAMMKIIPKELMMEFHDGIMQYREARYLSCKFNLPEEDAKHLLIAQETDAILVTRDHHFDHLKTRFDIYLPEELI